MSKHRRKRRYRMKRRPVRYFNLAECADIFKKHYTWCLDQMFKWDREREDTFRRLYLGDWR